MGLNKEKLCVAYSISRLLGVYSFTLFLCMIPAEIYAAWSSPAEIISGTWGSKSDQFGIRYEDMSDTFPRFTITSEGKIVVRDGINKRLKIYASIGGFETIIPYRTGRHYTELTLADSYGFSGEFVGYGKGEDNYYYRADQKIYINFSPGGHVSKTSTTRPLELGVVHQYGVGRAYKIKVTYPDNIYQFTTDQPLTNYYRDTSQNLFQIETFTETVGEDEFVSYRVNKFNRCSKKVSVLNLPRSQYEPLPPEASDMPTWKPVPIMEYGEPLVSSAGDVYAWARTKTHYKILKWTWVDDPNVATGPDAPTDLSVIPSTTGLYLTWKVSPQDPGCVTGYEVARATSSGGVYSTVGTVDKGVIKYNDTSASVGTTYYYKIRTVAVSEYSPYTSVVSGKR